MAKLVGDLARGQTGFVEAGGDGLAKRMRRDPRPWTRIAPKSLPAVSGDERPVVVQSVSGLGADLTLEGVEELPKITGHVVRIA
jgi:hypothetical protein